MSPNFQAVGAHLDASVMAGGNAALGPTLAYFANLTDRPTYDAAFSGMVPEQELALQSSLMTSSLAMADSVMSCHQPGAARDVLDEGQCVWTRQAHDWFSRATTQDEGFRQSSQVGSFGAQWNAGDHLLVGAAYGNEDTNLHSNTYRLIGTVTAQHFAFALKRPMGQTLLAASFNVGVSTLNATRTVNVTGPAVAQVKEAGATTWTLRGRVAHVFGGEHLYLKAVGDIGVTGNRSSAFAETGAGPLDFVADGAKHTSVWMAPRLEAGARFNAGGSITASPWVYVGGRLTDNAEMAVDGRFEGSPAGVAPFRLTSRGDERSRTLGVGVDVMGREHVTATIGFEGEYGERDRTEQGYVKLAWRF
jgi:hypothetical protein